MIADVFRETEIVMQEEYLSLVKAGKKSLVYVLCKQFRRVEKVDLVKKTLRIQVFVTFFCLSVTIAFIDQVAGKPRKYANWIVPSG